MNNIHLMHLNSPWFELVKQGKKIYEGRRYTETISTIKKGDIITFKHYNNHKIEPYNVVVEDIIKYQTFEDALYQLPIHDVLPIENITIEKGVEIYKKYVSIATQIRDGVVMIKIKTIDNNNVLFGVESEYL